MPPLVEEPPQPLPLRPRRAPEVDLGPAVAFEPFDGFIARLTSGGITTDWPRQVAEELQQRFTAERVIVAVRSPSGALEVRAVSGGGQWDKRTELAQAAQDVWRELLPLNATVIHPASCPSLQKVAEFSRLSSAFAIRCGDASLESAAILLGRNLDAVALRAAWSPHAKILGNAIRVWSAAERGGKPSWLATMRNVIRSKPVQSAFIAIGLLAGIACLPWPQYLAAEAVIEPVVRRFVAAPFEGPLLKTSVEPGDLVSAGQELARMDEERLRADRAAADAAVQEARRRHAAALAARQGAPAQAAEHELMQAEFKLAAIDRRLDQAVLRSPIDGLVVRGDLRRVEGTTVTVGQTLFEIAPPDSALAEVAIPEEDVALVRVGMPLTLRCDAFPAKSWSGSITRLHPRAELIDGKNVFVAEVRLEDTDELRPGMRGAVSIAGDVQPLGWNLIRRPWLSFRRWTGW